MDKELWGQAEATCKRPPAPSPTAAPSPRSWSLFVVVLAVLQGLPDLSSLARDRTYGLSSENAESSPLDHQGIPGLGVLAGKKGVVVWACSLPLPTLNTNPEERTTDSDSPFVNLWLRGLLDQLPVCRQEACGLLGSALQAPPGFLAWV